MISIVGHNRRVAAFTACAVAVLFWGALDLPAQYCVDPLRGNDLNPGTVAAPFRKVERARDAVRGVRASMTNDLVVQLRGGNYPVSATLRFDERDGGANGHRVIYQAYAGELPVLDAGVRVTGWQEAGHGIWKASVIGVENFRQLYINGVRANRARSKQVVSGTGWPNPYVSFTTNNWQLTNEFYPDGIKVASTAIAANWKNPKDIELVWIGEESKCTWRSHRLLVNSLEDGGSNSTIIKLDNYGFVMTSSLESRPLPEIPFYIENAYELMDEPGEWYFNRSTRELFYIPRAGEDLLTAEVYIPGTAETILAIAGSSLSKKVSDLVFDGLTFRHTTWLRPSTSRLGACCVQADKYIKGFGNIGRAHKAIFRKEFYFDPAYDYEIDAEGDAEGFKPVGSVAVNAAERITIQNCRFENLGGGGIDLTQGGNAVAIVGNIFRDLSATAIVIGRWDQDYCGPNEEVCKDGVIANNLITKVGQEYYNSLAITAFFTDGLTIRHNDLSDLPYSGISSGWGAWAGKGAWTTSNRRNVIENNHISNFCQKCSDGGGIYTVGIGQSRTDPNTVTSKIRGNFITGIGTGYGALYPDEGSCYYEITGNVSEQVETSTRGKWLHLWSKNHHDITVTDNFSDSPKLINKGINCRVTNNTVYKGSNRPAAAVEIIRKAGLEPAYSKLRFPLLELNKPEVPVP